MYVCMCIYVTCVCICNRTVGDKIVRLVGNIYSLRFENLFVLSRFASAWIAARPVHKYTDVTMCTCALLVVAERFSLRTHT